MADRKRGEKPYPKPVPRAASVAPAQLPALQPAAQEEGAARSPVWRQIEAALRAPVDGGVWLRGTRLPTEVEMAAHFQVNRHTVRRAVSLLVEEGYFVPYQGRGLYVSGGAKFHHQLTAVPDIGTQIAHSQLNHSSLFLGGSVEASGQYVADALGLVPHALVVRVRQVELGDAVPLALLTAWVCKERFPTFSDAFRGAGHITGALALSGMPEARAQQSTQSVRLVGKKEADLLQIAENAPLLRVEQVLVSKQEGAPVALVRTELISDRVLLMTGHSN